LLALFFPDPLHLSHFDFVTFALELHPGELELGAFRYPRPLRFEERCE
jgi:hypothetical protein